MLRILPKNKQITAKTINKIYEDTMTKETQSERPLTSAVRLDLFYASLGSTVMIQHLGNILRFKRLTNKVIHSGLIASLAVGGLNIGC